MEKIEQIEKYFQELKTNKKEKIEGSKFLKIQAYSCKLNNGYTIVREQILKNNENGSAAIIFALTEDNQVILAVEPRVFTERTVDIGLPAGYIEKGELPVTSAVRELEEETGYTSDDLTLLGSYYQDQGCSSAYNYYFLARNCRKVKEQNLDEGEFIKYILVTLEELEVLLENGYIEGLNSAYAIEKGRQYIKER